jgi:hypothetical protein
MATISDSEFRKAQSIALEKLRKKNLMGLLAAQRNGTLQEFVRPELEAYVRRVHPGKSLPANFQSSETTDEICHRHSESDISPMNDATTIVNSRKHSLPSSTKLPTQSLTESLPTQVSSTSIPQTPNPIPAPQSTPEKVPDSDPVVSSPPNKFQSSKPVSSGLAARMAALNSQNPSKNSPPPAVVSLPTRSSRPVDPSVRQPQFHSLASSAHLASKAKRLRSDAEYGEIVNVNLYRATILQNPELHRKRSGSRRHSLISGKDFSLVSVLSNDDNGLANVPASSHKSLSEMQSRRKSLQSLDQNSILERSNPISRAVAIAALEADNTSPRQSEMEPLTTVPFATTLSPEVSDVKDDPVAPASRPQGNGTGAEVVIENAPSSSCASLWEPVIDNVAEEEKGAKGDRELAKREGKENSSEGMKCPESTSPESNAKSQSQIDVSVENTSRSPLHDLSSSSQSTQQIESEASAQTDTDTPPSSPLRDPSTSTAPTSLLLPLLQPSTPSPQQNQSEAPTKGEDTQKVESPEPHCHSPLHDASTSSASHPSPAPSQETSSCCSCCLS